jgi:hypothetical protein
MENAACAELKFERSDLNILDSSIDKDLAVNTLSTSTSKGALYVDLIPAYEVAVAALASIGVEVILYSSNA